MYECEDSKIVQREIMYLGTGCAALGGSRTHWWKVGRRGMMLVIYDPRASVPAILDACRSAAFTERYGICSSVPTAQTYKFHVNSAAVCAICASSEAASDPSAMSASVVVARSAEACAVL